MIEYRNKWRCQYYDRSQTIFVYPPWYPHVLPITEFLQFLQRLIVAEVMYSHPKAFLLNSIRQLCITFAYHNFVSLLLITTSYHCCLPHFDKYFDKLIYRAYPYASTLNVLIDILLTDAVRFIPHTEVFRKIFRKVFRQVLRQVLRNVFLKV